MIARENNTTCSQQGDPARWLQRLSGFVNKYRFVFSSPECGVRCADQGTANSLRVVQQVIHDVKLERVCIALEYFYFLHHHPSLIPLVVAKVLFELQRI